jgi:hypothetical protein
MTQQAENASEKGAPGCSEEAVRSGCAFYREANKLDNVYQIAEDPVERKEQLEAKCVELVARWQALYEGELVKAQETTAVAVN